jgi:hypothetical protein
VRERCDDQRQPETQREMNERLRDRFHTRTSFCIFLFR